jgi:hypothetical protein
MIASASAVRDEAHAGRVNGPKLTGKTIAYSERDNNNFLYTDSDLLLDDAAAAGGEG